MNIGVELERKADMRVIMTALLLIALSLTNLYSQVNSPSKNVVRNKAPRFVLSASLSYDYAFSRNDVGTFSESIDPITGKNYFSSNTLAIQHGLGITTEGKWAINKNRRLRMTGDLSYNHFYNSHDKGLNRTRWQILNVGAGIEYNFQPRRKNSSYIGGEVLYTLMWGAWQTDVTYPDGSQSNIYIKFSPAHRLGIAVKTGMEFRMTKNTSFNLGIRGVWANIAPKQNKYSSNAYETFINDSQNSGGISLGSPKQIVFIQLLTGINFQLKY